MKERHRISRRTVAYRVCVILCTALAPAIGIAQVPPVQPSVAPITWRPCTPDLVSERWIDVLGARLECGSMLATPDDDVTGKVRFTVGLVRFKAGQSEQREGAIFFNFGGPGANPLDFLPPTAYLWASRSIDHSLDGDKRRLADRFDLVAVIPRGLRGGTRFACGPYPEFLAGYDPAVSLADWNWVGFVRTARAYAGTCGEHPLHPQVGTLQHVVDMEHARRALNEPVMHFVGTSYGSWVGAFYASMYPQYSGRIVLDSVMNYAGTFEQQVTDFPAERQALFARNALRPALARPGVYGIGSDPRVAMSRFRDMPYRALWAWPLAINTPHQLAAALTLADWIRADMEISSDRLMARLRNHVFSPDTGANDAIKEAAAGLASRLDQVVDPTLDGLVDHSVYIAVVCGDTPWRNDLKTWRALANRIGANYPAAGGGSVIMGLICAHWPSAPRWRPMLTELAKAPPLLMIQSEFDPVTPLTGAMKAFDASPNAYIVLARDAEVHGLFGQSATPCVERAAGRFLLTGERPASHLSSCDYVTPPVRREVREVSDAPTESDVREELRRLYRYI
ncbi:pimeloyl-ACP methyl ester carboxylesterase [Luteibacter jiangsuensis]|uniref:Pimeloyl-ACP methyl ester carboxylesterase n=1 Tax=Luteibacter jiangsuensis TaxID=637577 RepID=A0ABT9SXA8_9GAMM|nr:alpha/beta hydrolase [Luteibacter jiangsuensis]MDQ0009174.1 pimeloyl-ACP methyl ester carboxylesterase [Luteibacter jiangsuensis]